MADKVEVFEDHAGEWRWRRKSENGQIVATSGEGYERYDSAYTAAERENEDLEITIIGGEDSETVDSATDESQGEQPVSRDEPTP
jgi:uncharacterized protein YegP (UPF0339 family)